MIGLVLIGWSLASRRNFASSALCFHMCVVHNGNGEFCETGKSANGAWLFKGIVNSRRLTLSLEIRQRNHGSKNRCLRSVCNPSFFYWVRLQNRCQYSNECFTWQKSHPFSSFSVLWACVSIWFHWAHREVSLHTRMHIDFHFSLMTTWRACFRSRNVQPYQNTSVIVRQVGAFFVGLDGEYIFLFHSSPSTFTLCLVSRCAHPLRPALLLIWINGQTPVIGVRHAWHFCKPLAVPFACICLFPKWMLTSIKILLLITTSLCHPHTALCHRMLKTLFHHQSDENRTIRCWCC